MAKRSFAKILPAASAAFVALSLCGCGGDLYESNVMAFFLSEYMEPDGDLFENASGSLLLFEGFETYDAFDGEVRSLLDERQIELIADGLAEVADYMASSDDYLFIVWQFFGSGDEGRWFDFYDNTLTSHQAYGCIESEETPYTFDAVAVSRDLVEDFETVSFESVDHSVCNIWEELFG